MADVRFAISMIAIVIAIMNCGCSPELKEANQREISRVFHSHTIGPYQITAMIGNAAPTGGPSLFSAILIDTALTEHCADGEVKHSPWTIPDANRPIKIETAK